MSEPLEISGSDNW